MQLSACMYTEHNIAGLSPGLHLLQKDFEWNIILVKDVEERLEINGLEPHFYQLDLRLSMPPSGDIPDVLLASINIIICL